MKIGDRIFVRGYIDEIRKDTVIIRNTGGYFGTDPIEVITGELPPAQPEIIRCKDCRYYQDNNDGYPHINCKWDANETPDADDFCSGAERRTDEPEK